MVKKTIPQLQEATTITDNAYFVVDTGSVTKKISKLNLRKSMSNSAIRTITLTGQTLSPDDEIVLFASPDAPMGMDFTLPPADECIGKILYLKNIGTGLCGGYGNEFDVEMIDGVNTLDLSGLNKAAIIACDGSNWFIFS